MKGQKKQSLKAVFQKYVRAVQQGDLRTLFTTVTTSSKFYFLTAQGRTIRTRKGYYNFHKKWFKKKAWKMPVKLIHSYEGGDFGYTIAVFNYKEQRPDRSIYLLDSYFTLIFKREKGNWRVVADVCTPIKQRII